MSGLEDDYAALYPTIKIAVLRPIKDNFCMEDFKEVTTVLHGILNRDMLKWVGRTEDGITKCRNTTIEELYLCAIVPRSFHG